MGIEKAVAPIRRGSLLYSLIDNKTYLPVSGEYECVCGMRVKARPDNVRSLKTISCGCWREARKDQLRRVRAAIQQEDWRRVGIYCPEYAAYRAGANLYEGVASRFKDEGPPQINEADWMDLRSRPDSMPPISLHPRWSTNSKAKNLDNFIEDVGGKPPFPAKLRLTPKADGVLDKDTVWWEYRGVSAPYIKCFPELEKRNGKSSS